MNIINKKDKILVVTSHTDDEVLGCGGLILYAKKIGAKVELLCLGEGVSSRFTKKNYKEQIKAHNIRTNEFIKAISILGIKKYQLDNRLCNQFDTLTILSIVKTIENYISNFKPTIVFTHNDSEVNIDHSITYKAVEVASRPTKHKSVKRIYSFSIPCSGNWTFNSKFKPNVFFDISEVWNDKIKAWKCYKNETRPFPFPRSLKAIKIIAEFYGLQSGLTLAEAFRLERMIIDNENKNI